MSKEAVKTYKVTFFLGDTLRYSCESLTEKQLSKIKQCISDKDKKFFRTVGMWFYDDRGKNTWINLDKVLTYYYEENK